MVAGTLPGACYAGGMTSFLYAKGIRIFDYPGKWGQVSNRNPTHQFDSLARRRLTRATGSLSLFFMASSRAIN